MRALFILFLSFSLVGAMAAAQVETRRGFERFAKSLTIELGSDFDGVAATAALREYLAEADVDNPLDFFQENMDVFSTPIKVSDENLEPSRRNLLLRNSALWLRAFHVTFPVFPLGERELRVVVFGRDDGSTTFRAYTFFHGL